ncbi:MAG: hypothetical protein RIQ60_2409 [Pseudomonadota bacterium]|jgi:hypothetical protein
MTTAAAQTPSRAPQGFLAIWCEIGTEDFANHRNWLTQEPSATASMLGHDAMVCRVIYGEALYEGETP